MQQQITGIAEASFNRDDPSCEPTFPGESPFIWATGNHPMSYISTYLMKVNLKFLFRQISADGQRPPGARSRWPRQGIQ